MNTRLWLILNATELLLNVTHLRQINKNIKQKKFIMANRFKKKNDVFHININNKKLNSHTYIQHNTQHKTNVTSDFAHELFLFFLFFLIYAA